MDQLVLQIMKETVKNNSDEVHRTFFVDRVRKVAFGGHRRTWGVGDLFTRYTGEIDFEMHPGIYEVHTNNFIRNKQLAGQKVEGQYTELDIETVDNMFASAYETIGGLHVIDVNPKQVLEFIEDATFQKGKHDSVINLQPTYGMFDRQVPMKVVQENGEWIAIIETPQRTIGAKIQKEGSYVNLNTMKENEIYLCEVIGEVNGHRVVKVMRPYVAGIRMAVQQFRGGCLMNGQPRYSVIPYQDGNDIQVNAVKDFKFMPTQDFTRMTNAPMLTIQLDTFMRIMKSCVTFKYVRIAYKDNFTPFVAETLDDTGYKVECLASPLSPYRNGKVITI